MFSLLRLWLSSKAFKDGFYSLLVASDFFHARKSDGRLFKVKLYLSDPEIDDLGHRGEF